MTDANVEVVAALFESISGGDLPRLLSTVHDECVMHEAESLPHGGDWRGPDGLQELVGRFGAVLGLTINKYELFQVDENLVISRTDATFHSTGSGRSVDLPYVELFRVRNGKIVDVDIFYKDTKVLSDLAAETAAPASRP